MINLSTMRGAMFGIDARITLAIAAIIALVIGLQQTQRIDRQKVVETEHRLAKIKAASLSYYRDGGFLPSDIAGDLTAFDNSNQPYLEIADTTDAWGNSFLVLSFTGCGFHAETTSYSQNMVVISSGPDETFNYDYNANYNGLGCDEIPGIIESLIVGDDIMIKISTHGIDAVQFTRLRKYLEEIQHKIIAFAEHKRLRWQRTCEATGVATSGCDYDEDGTYIKGEEQSLNFFPMVVETVVGCPSGQPKYADYYDTLTAYIMANASDRQSLMTLLGLPVSYATVNGTALKYDSNDGNRCSGPFSFKVYY